MKQFSRRKYFKDHGLVLITALSIMVILLIISFAIVSLSTGNLKTAGNVNARLQALNLANSASIYAIYEIQSCCDPNGFLWAPGAMPTPVPAMTFTTYDPIASVQLNNLPGRCSIAYINNLDNPNPNIAAPPGGTFSSFVISSVDIPGNGAVIFSQGIHEGFKRTLKITLKHSYYSSVIDGVMNFGNGVFMLNGIENLTTLAPLSGSLYAKTGINYNNIEYYKIFNGSKLVSGGSIPPPGSGPTIDPIYIKPGHHGIASVENWTLGDPNLIGGMPTDANSFVLFNPGDTIWYNASIEPFSGPAINRPSFGIAPAIGDNQRYEVQGSTTNWPIYEWVTPFGLSGGNYFVNGSLYVKGDLQILNGCTLFVNGTLEVDGRIGLNSDGKLIVAGYYNDPNEPGTYGLAMEIKDLPGGADRDKWHGVDESGQLAIFTDGDIKFNSHTSPQGVGPWPDPWLSITPLDITTVIDTFASLGLNSTTNGDALNWYNTGSGTEPLITFSGFTGKEILTGQANTEMAMKGLKPVPQEVIDWFSSPSADIGFSWATETPYRWNTFKKNPSFYPCTRDLFLEGAIYTHGTLTTEGTPYTINILGCVVAKNDPNSSPPGHGGNIKFTMCSSIILYPEYFKSGKPIIKPILSVYSWEELY